MEIMRLVSVGVEWGWVEIMGDWGQGTGGGADTYLSTNICVILTFRMMKMLHMIHKNKLNQLKIEIQRVTHVFNCIKKTATT